MTFKYPFITQEYFYIFVSGSVYFRCILFIKEPFKKGPSPSFLIGYIFGHLFLKRLFYDTRSFQRLLFIWRAMLYFISFHGESLKALIFCLHVPIFLAPLGRLIKNCSFVHRKTCID